MPLLLLVVACTMLASQVKEDLAEAASICTDTIELAVSAGSVTVLATMPVFQCWKSWTKSAARSCRHWVASLP